MDLILTVVADPQGANMRNHTKVFDKNGGSFGRADDNTWVLPDPERVVSSHHARIQFESGKYFLVDSSTNGTFLNEAASAIERESKQLLNDGDVLGVGDYRLKVTMRVPEINPSLPKGLAPVDFFDENADKTRMGNTNLEKMQSGESLDHYLDPNVPKQQDEQWGFIADQSEADGANKPDEGPLMGGFSSGEPMGEEVDPLVGLGGKDDKSEIAWDNDEDWWKSSEADSAPVDRHSIDVKPRPEQAPPKEPSPSPPPTPPPVDVADPEPEEANPFQASAALVKGQKQDSSDILDSVGASPQKEPQRPQIPVPVKRKPEKRVESPKQERAPQRQVPSPQPGRRLSAARPAESEAPPSPQPRGDLQDMRALAESLGLNNLSDEQLQSLIPEAATIIQESISRLIELMRARTSVKNELRVAQTMIQLQDNNPLKFSANAKDAINAMFGSSNPAFMSPTEAIADSFNDLSDHQVAVLSGMRSAYEFMLKQFSPEMLEGRLNIKLGTVVLSKNAKKWEAFEKFFESLKRDPESSYRRLFGEEFANAYEMQLAELKNSRQMNRRDG